ncbi:MAG TPA: beta-ketoacyl synthase N-terminal-like domain-containing protein [Ramlibacter sp.]|jgi:malonyl-ACP decarboxylase
MSARAGSAAPPVFVTGMGVLSAIGHDVAAFAEALFAGRSGIGRLGRLQEPRPAVDLGAPLSFEFEALLARHAGLPSALLQSARHAARRSPFSVQASMGAALQAWEQAGLHRSAPAPDRIGLVAGGNNTTRHYQYAATQHYAQQPAHLSPRYALLHQDTDQLGVLSQAFALYGEGFTTGGASASGNVALVQGLRLVRAGVVDACLVVGVVADLSPMELQGYHVIGALGGRKYRDDPERACRPFDAGHEGFIPGQAAACMVLESEASARGRGAPLLARLAGGAIALHGTSQPDPSADGELRAMAGALRDAGLAEAAVDYVNTHGTASPRGDAAEIEALQALFGERLPQVWLNATKALTGHCLSSAGVVEAIATILQLRAGRLHPNLNLADPIHPHARFCGPAAQTAQVRTALSNSFGFGGINTSIVLQREPA